MFAELLIAELHRRAVDLSWVDADLAVVNVFILLHLFKVRKESRPFVVRTPDAYGTRIHLFSPAIDSATGINDGEPNDSARPVRPVVQARVDVRQIRFNSTIPPDLEEGSTSRY